MSRSRHNPPPPSRPAGPKIAADALFDGDANDPGKLFLRRAMWLEALDLQLRPGLPSGVAAHARLANVNHGRLVYLVDAPVWHAKLRLAATDVLEVARSIGLEVTELVVKVATGPHAMRAPAVGTSNSRSAPPLSAAAREAFAAALAARDEESSEPDPS